MKRIFSAVIFFCLSCQALAAYFSVLPSADSPKLYIAAGAGDMFYDVSGTNFVGTGTGWPNDRYNINRISDQAYGFIEAGYAWDRPERWLPRYGLGARYIYVPKTTISGSIDQYSLPGFNNYNYNYDVDMLSLLAVFKADIYRMQNWMPYVIAGAGITAFGTSNYTEQATSGVTPRVSPGFSGNSGNNFTFQMGLGIDYALLQSLLINLEYDYIHYGSIRTGKGANYPTLTTNYDNESLKNDIKATTLFLGVTYTIS